MRRTDEFESPALASLLQDRRFNENARNWFEYFADHPQFNEAACEWLRAFASAPEIAFQNCPSPTYLLWLAAAAGAGYRDICLAACRCARLALAYLPGDDPRALRSIEAAESLLDGTGTLEAVSEDAQRAVHAENEYRRAAVAAVTAENARREAAIKAMCRSKGVAAIVRPLQWRPDADLDAASWAAATARHAAWAVLYGRRGDKAYVDFAAFACNGVAHCASDHADAYPRESRKVADEASKTAWESEIMRCTDAVRDALPCEILKAACAA